MARGEKSTFNKFTLKIMTFAQENEQKLEPCPAPR